MKTKLASTLALMAACGLAAVAAAPATSTARASRARLSSPVISEKFTALPCAGAPNNRTTVEQEGCAEHQILTSDKKIDALNKTIFAEFSTNAARRHFISGHSAWLNYRTKYCLSFSDIAAGGTGAPVLDAQCTAHINAEHITDLKQLTRDLNGG